MTLCQRSSAEDVFLTPSGRDEKAAGVPKDAGIRTTYETISLKKRLHPVQS